MAMSNNYGAFGGNTDLFGNELKSVPNYSRGVGTVPSLYTGDFDKVKPEVIELCRDFFNANGVKPTFCTLPWSNNGLKGTGFYIQDVGTVCLDIKYDPSADAIEIG